MELVKNIFFNTDKLTEGAEIKISYAGIFFSDSSEKVYMHYGFGKDWKDSSDIEMEKTDLGFQTEIKLTNDETFNFCFFNEKNNWDNNYGQNYIFKIESNTDFKLKTQEENLLPSPVLNKFYLWRKKFRKTIYKVVTYLPNLILGRYKRKKIQNQ